MTLIQYDCVLIIGGHLDIYTPERAPHEEEGEGIQKVLWKPGVPGAIGKPTRSQQGAGSRLSLSASRKMTMT